MLQHLVLKGFIVNILLYSIAADMEFYQDPESDPEARGEDYRLQMRRLIDELGRGRIVPLTGIKPSKINPVARTREQRKQKILESSLQEYIYDDSDDIPPEDFTFYPEIPDMNETDNKQFAVNPFQPEYYEGLYDEEPNKLPDTSTENKENVPIFLGMIHKMGNEVEPPRIPRQNPNLAATKMNKIAGSGEISQSGSPLTRKFTSGRDIPTSLVPTSPRQQHVIQQAINATTPDYSEIHVYVQAAMLGTGAAAVLVVLSVGIYTLILLRRSKDNGDAEYPAYGVTGPNTDVTPSGDRRLAQSAQMYHYQHQKQQIIAMENSRTGVAERIGSVSDAESEDENEEGDYTVYECPGFATTGEMEVKNPLFLDEPTPATCQK